MVALANQTIDDTNSHDGSAPDALRRLLCTCPESVLTGAGELADILSQGGKVSVLGYRGDHWLLLAGNEAVCDEEDLRDIDPTAQDTGSVGSLVFGPGVALAFAEQDTINRFGVEQLRQACVWLAQAQRADLSHERMHDATEEADSQRAVADQILTVRDVDQVLLSITNQTLGMLQADICGVFLREDDELQMRCCTGHRVVTTERLRMRRGQGVAGLVFDTGEVAKVDSYLDDRTISQDFMSLAEQEQTRSALAVPLRAHGELIGVLEVWRRRHSVFTARDVRRLASLSDLATIAIENAHLYEQQRRANSELRETHADLQHKLSLLRRSSALQRSLIQAVLDDTATPTAIAQLVGQEMQCQVAVLADDYQIEVVYPPDFAVTGLAEHITKSNADATTSARRELVGGIRCWVAGVRAGGNSFGAVCLIGGDESDEVMEAACGQAAMASSLARAEQHAASRARAEAFDQILWDLLSGPEQHRMAARTRAQHMGVRLKGPHRIIYGQFDNLTALAARRGWDTSGCERARRDTLDAIRTAHETPALQLAGMRGDCIVAIAAVDDRALVRELMDTVNTAAGAVSGGELALSWGVSTVRENPCDYPSAFNEAKTALAAARRLATGGVTLYDELGIVRLLLGSHEDPDYHAFISEVTQPIIDYDRRHDGALMATLRGFFDADCSQKEAAKRMYVHHKTLSYRLERIKDIAGLDLARHADRMRADLALRLLDVTETMDNPNTV
ncbi:GAF domain-containing protein [Prauserella halophila]|uniref:GAF domain-containing protein n=1 Tax=Prauserella halophila TaxID=185641 RepID=A0ABP4GY92_9PSEU|nr:helix-turn-helix domain-containing protein [Prauserella halophila]MCP2235801.1 GAF domain-containing protein [Prauserella halophila]